MTVSTKAASTEALMEASNEAWMEGAMEEASMEASTLPSTTSTEASTTKNLTNKERTCMLHYLLSYGKSGVELDKLRMGALKSAALKFHCTTKTVARIWQRYLATMGLVETCACK